LRLIWLRCLSVYDKEKLKMKEFRCQIQLLLGALFALSFLFSGLFAEDRILTAHKVAKIRTVTGAEISPDGKLVAYTLSVPRKPGDGEDGAAWVELHLVDMESRKSRPFVTGEVNVGSIDWVPAKRMISFVAKRGDDEFNSLYTIPVDGGESRKALELESDVLAYSWNRDGSHVAVIAAEPDKEEIKKLKEQGFSQEIYEEDWRRRRVYVVEPFESADPPKALELDSNAFAVEWSPIDDRLALVLAPTPLIDDSYMHKRVSVVDASSGRVLAQLKNPGKLGQVKWSPGGKSLAMISGADLHDPSEGRLLVGSSSGGELRDLIPDHPGQVGAIAWKSDDAITIVNEEGVKTSLETVNISTGERVIETDPQGPAINSLSQTDNGNNVACVASTPSHPNEVFFWNRGDRSLTRLTDSNPWLKDVRLAPQEVVSFKARDGLDLEGLLIRPLDEVQGQRYPLILTVHGGPESHHKNGWLTSYSNPGQMAAALGMAVFYTNYRGSTGRGVDFSKLSQGDPAGKEFDDLVDAVDHLIAIGLVDKDRVGVTGGSYGGYATAWCSTFYSERFAAGVMFVGISNKISKVGTTDIPEEEFLVHALKRPWDDWEFFLKRSPIYYADRGKTPLLILHGKDDPRVNVGQSRELYRHLKLRGEAPVRLVMYPGEKHGNRRAASRLDYSLRMLRWFKHFLLGDGGALPDYKVSYEDPSKSSGK
jgi:dipeptidyl aminopeptidase/acylaminoacyl peptidase